MTQNFLDLPGLSLFLNKIKDLFATKDIVSVSKPGLVPPPSSADSQKVLYGNSTWQFESVSLSSDNAYEPLDGGDA